MKTLAEIFDSMDKWCPAVVVWLLKLAVAPLVIFIRMCLPADSKYQWHKLHKIRSFWEI